METYIYGLSDPTTDAIRYIGKSNSPTQRLQWHVSNAKKRRTHKDCWIWGLLEVRLKPVLKILAVVEEGEWQQWEKYYIRLFREQGYDLCNHTDGGEGLNLSGKDNPFYGKKHTLETRRKISEATKGRKTWNKGLVNPYSCETVKKMSNSHKGKSLSAEHKQNISSSVSGAKHPLYQKTHTATARQKISESRSRFAIHKYDQFGSFIEAYGTIANAAKELGLSKKQVRTWASSGCCKNGFSLHLVERKG